MERFPCPRAGEFAAVFPVSTAHLLPPAGSQHGACAQPSSRTVWNLVGLPGTVHGPRLSHLPLPFPSSSRQRCVLRGPPGDRPLLALLRFFSGSLAPCWSGPPWAEGSWGHPGRRKRWPLSLSPSPLVRIATLTLGAKNNISGYWREGLQFYYLKENVFALVDACHSLLGGLLGTWRGEGTSLGHRHSTAPTSDCRCRHLFSCFPHTYLCKKVKMPSHMFSVFFSECVTRSWMVAPLTHPKTKICVVLR